MNDTPAIIAGLNVLADGDRITHEKLDIIVEAITAEPEPSKVAPALEELAAAVNRLAEETARNTEAVLRVEAQTKPKPNGHAGAGL